MKRLILGAVVAGIAIVGISTALPVQTRPQPASASQPSTECPAGSYYIGSKDGINPICKLEPTGCPYGDSIPMDMCDKFAPQPEQPAPVEQPKPAETQPAQCGGK